MKTLIVLLFIFIAATSSTTNKERDDGITWQQQDSKYPEEFSNGMLKISDPKLSDRSVPDLVDDQDESLQIPQGSLPLTYDIRIAKPGCISETHAQYYVDTTDFDHRTASFTYVIIPALECAHYRENNQNVTLSFRQILDCNCDAKPKEIFSTSVDSAITVMNKVVNYLKCNGSVSENTYFKMRNDVEFLYYNTGFDPYVKMTPDYTCKVKPNDRSNISARIFQFNGYKYNSSSVHVNNMQMALYNFGPLVTTVEIDYILMIVFCILRENVLIYKDGQCRYTGSEFHIPVNIIGWGTTRLRTKDGSVRKIHYWIVHMFFKWTFNRLLWSGFIGARVQRGTNRCRIEQEPFYLVTAAKMKP